MFYEKYPDKALRFGDVLSGFISSIPEMSKPIADNRHPEYKLSLNMPDYCVVLSPCCSIGDSTITLAQLRPVLKSFFKNPYYEEDLTNINRRATPDKTVPPYVWNGYSEEEKRKREEEGNTFALLEYFIYAPHENLPTYQITIRQVERAVGHYLIDFRRSFRVDCSSVHSAEESPLETKILQLTVDARRQLREKISGYYSRAPADDLAALAVA